MSLRPVYPDVVPGQGFVFIHEPTHSFFQSHTLDGLHRKVAEFARVNEFTVTNDEFEDNVCRNTPNLVCTDSVRGLGDIVHLVVNPMAKIVDRIAGTNLQGCGGCRSRQEALNKI